MPLKWYGDEIKANVLAASIAAVNETLEATRDEAQRDHWWESRSGHNLEHQTITEPAKPTLGGVSGKVGTTRRQGFYGLFLEIREPFLRPIGDRIFPTLPARLRAHYER